MVVQQDAVIRVATVVPQDRVSGWLIVARMSEDGV
jgi:hypothetical protein